MYFAGAKSIDFCLISGIFFNFYCVTAHIHGQQPFSSSSPYPSNPSNPLYSNFPRGDGLIQSDMIKVSYGANRGTDYHNRFYPPPHLNHPSFPALPGSSYGSYGSTLYRPGNGIGFDNRLGTYWPYHQRDHGLFKPLGSSSPHGSSSSSSALSPQSSGSSPTSSSSSYPSHSGLDPSHASNPLYPNYGYSSNMPYSYNSPTSAYPDQRNDWYARYPNYPLFPHTAEYLSSGYPYSVRVVKAIAEMRSPEKVSGTITFEQSDEKVVVIRGRVLGLTPGAHGMHILDKISKGSECSAGDHFNPLNVAHGGKHDWVRHVGDLGNIFADRDGVAYFDMTDQIITLTGDHSVLNRTIIITERPDDLGRLTDPESKRNGSSGNPVACGSIELARY